MLKHSFILISLIVVILFLILVYVFYPWLSIIYGALFLSTPPAEPAITYGEFPISIEYEVDGEVRFIEDIIICEFDGFESYGMNEQKRKWKTTLKSGGKLLLLKIDNDTEIYCKYFSAKYFMDDLQYSTQEEYEDFAITNYLMLRKLQDGKYVDTVISFEEAEKLYNLKIISFNYSKPIKNSFLEK